MTVPFLPYGKQSIDDADVAAVVAVLRSPALTQGPAVEIFERALVDYVGGGVHATVVANGTAALHVAYAALGLETGDEIVTTPITFAATANAARYLGAHVRFADVDPRTGNLLPESVEAAIGPKTRGIAAVHLGGLPADLAELRAIADRRGIWLAEDASHALGATYRGAVIGGAGLGDAVTFSFHPVKHVTTGEGGAVMVADPALKRRMDRLRHHGIERDPVLFSMPSPGPWYHEVAELGWNYRLTDLQCALGTSQMAKQPAWLARRQQIAARYRAAIAGGPSGVVSPQAEQADRRSAYHLFPVLIDFAAAGCTRAQVMNALRERGIGTQVHYIPVSWQPYYRSLYGEPASLPGVETYYARELSLPMYPGLSDGDVDRVVGALFDVLKDHAP